MVWGCMSATSVGKIYILKRSINATVYQAVQDHFLIPYIENKFGDNQFIFQHNIAISHIVKPTKEWFKEKRIPVLDWPVNSPDTNPKENFQEILKRRLRKYYPSNLKEMKSLLKCWHWCYQRFVMVNQFVTRMNEKILNVKGATTKY